MRFRSTVRSSSNEVIKDLGGESRGQAAVGQEEGLEDQDDGCEERGDAYSVEDYGETGSGGVGAGARDGRDLQRGEQEYERSGKGDGHLLLGVLSDELDDFLRTEDDERDWL